jgi:hypothetical protein
MAAGGSGWRAEGGNDFYTRLGVSVGDEGVTAEMLAMLRRLGARAYGDDVADGPPIRGARVRRRSGADSVRLGVGMRWCAGDLGQSEPRAARMRAHVAACDALPGFVLLVPCLK